jgi:hypothetical protein
MLPPFGMKFHLRNERWFHRPGPADPGDSGTREWLSAGRVRRSENAPRRPRGEAPPAGCVSSMASVTSVAQGRVRTGVPSLNERT